MWMLLFWRKNWRRTTLSEWGKKIEERIYLGAEVDGDVTDIVALISLIIGALLERFRLTTGQSTSMAVTLL